MAQRISRAKQSIKKSGVRFQMPTADERAERLGAVLHVLYLIFNEGYASSTRRRACSASICRARRSGSRARCTACCRTTARSPGLLALMLLTDARRAGAHRPRRRADPARRAGPQRCGIAPRSPRASRWSRATLSRGAVGAYQLQAAIAAVHDEAARAEDTDWPQILALYGLLCDDGRQPDGDAQPRDRRGDGARAGAPGSRCSTRSTRDARLAGHHRLDAVRAHLLERAGDREARARALPRRGRPDDEHPGAQLPDQPRGSPHRPGHVARSGRGRGAWPGSVPRRVVIGSEAYRACQRADRRDRRAAPCQSASGRAPPRPDRTTSPPSRPARALRPPRAPSWCRSGRTRRARRAHSADGHSRGGPGLGHDAGARPPVASPRAPRGVRCCPPRQASTRGASSGARHREGRKSCTVRLVEGSCASSRSAHR